MDYSQAFPMGLEIISSLLSNFTEGTGRFNVDLMFWLKVTYGSYIAVIPKLHVKAH